MKRTFIFNPNSGQGLRPASIDALRRFFLERTGNFNCLQTADRDDATRLTQQAIRDGAEQIVAIGGDGTASAVANGFFEGDRPIRREARLAVANLGTACDYFRSIAGGRRVDWREVVLEHDVRAVDVGCARALDRTLPSQRFLNMTSFGLPAEVVRMKSRLPRWLPRQLKYLLPILIAVCRCRSHAVHLTMDGEEFRGKALAITVAKGRFAGGGIPFGSEAALDDGQFDVSLFLPMSLPVRLARLGKLYTGAFKQDSAVRTWKARRVVVRAQPAWAAEIDGDEQTAGDCEIAIEPRSLLVCFPQAAAAEKRESGTRLPCVNA